MVFYLLHYQDVNAWLTIRVIMMIVQTDITTKQRNSETMKQRNETTEQNNKISIF